MMAGATPGRAPRLFMTVALACGALGAVATACSTNNGPPSKGAPPPDVTPCAPAADSMLKLEYEAVTTDGHYLVTFVSRTSSSAADDEATRRIFYGVPSRMEEGREDHVDYSCARYITFTLAETTFTATVPGSLCGNSVPARLDFSPVGGPSVPFMTLRLTVLSETGQPSDAGPPLPTLSYACF
jgi:hypothetical protein